MICRACSLGPWLLGTSFSCRLRFRPKQFVDARLHLVGAIDVKGEIRDAARPQPLEQRVPDVPARGHESFDGLRLFLRAASIDGNIDEPLICRPGSEQPGLHMQS